jgi:hypothetical protein
MKLYEIIDNVEDLPNDYKYRHDPRYARDQELSSTGVTKGIGMHPADYPDDAGYNNDEYDDVDHDSPNVAIKTKHVKIKTLDKFDGLVKRYLSINHIHPSTGNGGGTPMFISDIPNISKDKFDALCKSSFSKHVLDDVKYFINFYSDFKMTKSKWRYFPDYPTKQDRSRVYEVATWKDVVDAVSQELDTYYNDSNENDFD